MPYCPECGADVETEDQFCYECGADLDRTPSDTEYSDPSATTTHREDTRPRSHRGRNDSSWRDEYSTAVWILAALIAVLTFPIGLLVPAYFYLKASGDTPVNQSQLEIWTVLIWGIIGMAAVELGGEKGAKALWAIIGAFILIVILALI